MSTKTKISEMPVLTELTSDIIVPASQKSGQTYISGTISLEALENYLKSDLYNHINNANQHISDEERNAWNKAVTTLEAFLKDADTSENAVDTLVELQRLMDGDAFDATELLNRIAALESIDYATKADIPEMPNLDGYATKGEVGTLQAVQQMLVNTMSTWSKTEDEPQSIKGQIKTAIDAQNENIATNYALKSDIPAVPSIEGLATEEYVDNAVASIEIPEVPSLDNYALKSDIPEMPNLDGYAKLEDIPTVPSLDNYALKSDIPSTAGFLKMDSKNSLVGGTSCSSTHSNSLVYGNGLQSDNNNATILGNYNKTLGWSNLLLSVGNGTSSARTNVFVIQGGNEQAIHINGSCKQSATWIADFGEYFEWNDGNPNNEDRIGYLVQLNDGKIELAESIDNAIGVISATCAFIGAACSLEWHDRFLRDNWGRLITDENGNMVENPEYNPDLEYVPRENRKEWDVVGLVGQVLTRQDGTLKVNGYAGCKDGIATASDHGYRVLKIVNDNIALVLVK